MAHCGNDLHSLARSRVNRVTTDSEEELLTRILLTMSRSTSSIDQSKEDESDYANLWDSESGSSGTTFQTNKDVMGSLMRKKVTGQLSNDSDRRKAWITSDSSNDSSSGHSNSNMYSFDMDKFKSLQEKAENMDLTLTDFFSDLKHSNSILELSKIFSSTQQLASNGKHCFVVLCEASTGQSSCYQTSQITDYWYPTGVDKKYYNFYLIKMAV